MMSSTAGKRGESGYDRGLEKIRLANLASVPQILGEAHALLAGGARELGDELEARNARAIRRGCGELRRRHLAELGGDREAANAFWPAGQRGRRQRPAKKQAETPAQTLARVARGLFYVPRGGEVEEDSDFC